MKPRRMFDAVCPLSDGACAWRSRTMRPEDRHSSELRHLTEDHGWPEAKVRAWVAARRSASTTSARAA